MSYGLEIGWQFRIVDDVGIVEGGLDALLLDIGA